MHETERERSFIVFHVGSDALRVNLAPCHCIREINMNCNIIYVCIYMNLTQNLISRFCLARLIYSFARKLTLHLVKRMWCGLFIMPMLNIIFILALNLNEVNIPSHQWQMCSFFVILCSFVSAERIHYLEYEWITPALTISHTIFFIDVL